MPQENENVFIAESQSLNVGEQQKKDILYQFSLLWSQIGNRAELFKCRGRKRGKKFA